MKRLATALTLALLVAGSGSAAMADGAADWGKHCAKCHGADGKGSKMGRKLGVRDHSDKQVQATYDDARAAKSIAEGVKGDAGKIKMKAFKDKLDAAAIQGVIGHLRSLAK